MNEKAALQQEWVTLQNNHERYESGSLAIKLVTVVLACAGVAFELESWFVGLFVLVLWLQEGIFKTWQSRLGERLVQLEGLIAQDSPLRVRPSSCTAAGWRAVQAPGPCWRNMRPAPPARRWPFLMWCCCWS
jgi:hypothetical protein